MDTVINPARSSFNPRLTIIVPVATLEELCCPIESAKGHSIWGQGDQQEPAGNLPVLLFGDVDQAATLAICRDIQKQQWPGIDDAAVRVAT
jgi:hypothetical protein